MPLSDIQTLLDSFAPIQLIEMERVMLMNRAESKYLFAVSKLPVLLEELSEHYKILDIGTIRTFILHTTGERQAQQARKNYLRVTIRCCHETNGHPVP
jgi:hypothetical protein